MIPKSMTDVMSLNTLACSSAVRAGVAQYGHEVIWTPAASSAFDPQSAKAPVTPHGRPASASVAMLTAASPSAPATRGQGPRSRLVPGTCQARAWHSPGTAPARASRHRLSTTHAATAIDAKSAMLIANAGHTPNVATSEIGLSAGSRSHHGKCATPITDPAMNAASVTSIRVLPPPLVYKV